MNAIVRPHMPLVAGNLCDQPALQRQVICFLRLWAASDSGKADVLADLGCALGPVSGNRVFQLWGDLCDLYDQYCYRPLTVQSPDESQINGDEAMFAQMIAMASEGNREDTMLAALMTVRADVAPIVTSLATQVGLSIRRSQLRAEQTAWSITHRGGLRLN